MKEESLDESRIRRGKYHVHLTKLYNIYIYKKHQNNEQFSERKIYIYTSILFLNLGNIISFIIN